MFETRMNALRHRLGKDGIDVAVITDDDNIYYLTGYYDYLHMEFGRPTILMVHRAVERWYGGRMARRIARIDKHNKTRGNRTRPHTLCRSQIYT